MKPEEIIEKFEAGLDRAQAVLLAALIDAIRAATTSKGDMKSKRLARELLDKVEAMIDGALAASNYEGLIAELVENFDEIDAAVLAAHLETSGLAVDAGLFTPQKRLFIESLTTSLMAGGIRAEFVLPMRQVLFSYMRRRLPVSELEKIVRESAAMDLKRWAGTTARDAVYGYMGAAHEAVKAHYGMDGYLYTGSIRENTRGQCLKWVNAGEQPDSYWEEQIGWAKRGGTYQGRRVSGFKPDTVLANFSQNRGGHGCLHEAIPVFVDKKSP